MYCLGCLQNEKHSTESPAGPSLFGGLQGVKRKEGSLHPWGKKNLIFFFKIYVIDK